MLRKTLNCLTALLLFLSASSGNSAPRELKNTPQGFNEGPDIITGVIGELGDLEQFGFNGTQVGLGVSTTSCNAGNVEVQFFALPATNHPVIMHNLYRMSGGANNNDRFEQIGQSWVKHAFGADQFESCFSCTPGDFMHLGVGCSDTYANFQNAEADALGSRALVNPFTGVFLSSANNHTGHVHTETSHRILVEGSDLNTTLNPGANYYAEVQYISSDEYNWCQAHPGQCNMYNNASYLRYSVSGTTNFFFTPIGSTVRMAAAINAWTGATINPIEPEPGVDGRAYIGFKVTGPDAGVWHYEYAIYNENLDRAIQSFTVPMLIIPVANGAGGPGPQNIEFHAPPQHPGYPNDGTQGNAGFSSAAWVPNLSATSLTWSTETFAQNQNANAIRWGTLYNFRFDSGAPPQAADATIGFFKTGAPITVAIQGPGPTGGPSATPGPTGTPGNPTPTPTPSGPTPTPGSPAQAINLSTRVRVAAGDGASIGGFIITGTAPKHVLLRAIGPSLAASGISDYLADPVLELHGPPGFTTITNDNWMDGSEIIGPPPQLDPLEAAIAATLEPGAYTAIVKGNGNPVGVALVEIYDLDNQPIASKLANLSTRALVNTGNEVVIAGFILGGNGGGDRIAVRGLGPSLASAGLSNTLANPTLELRDGSGSLLITNDNWQDNQAQASELTAAGLAPANSQESALVSALPPGAYTALLAGANSGTGVGLIEVYDLGSP